MFPALDELIMHFLNIVSPLYPGVLHLQNQLTADQRYLGENFKKVDPKHRV